MDKKYELTNKRILIGGATLYKIRALIDFCTVRVGDLGGYVQSEDNLSQDGDCWVRGNACVYENARVSGDAHVIGCAEVYGNARIYGAVYISETAHIYGDACVHLDRYNIGGNTRLSHGVWTQMIIMRHKVYLISSTLEEILME